MGITITKGPLARYVNTNNITESLPKEPEPEETGIIKESTKEKIKNLLKEHLSIELRKNGIDLDKMESDCIKELKTFIDNRGRRNINKEINYSFSSGSTLSLKNGYFFVTIQGKENKVEKNEIINALKKCKGFTSFCVELGRPYTSSIYTGEITKRSKNKLINIINNNFTAKELRELNINLENIPIGHQERIKEQYGSRGYMTLKDAFFIGESISQDAGSKELYLQKLEFKPQYSSDKNLQGNFPISKEQLKMALLLTKDVGWTEFCTTLGFIALCEQTNSDIVKKLSKTFTQDYVNNFKNNIDKAISNITTNKNITGQHNYFGHLYEIIKENAGTLSDSTDTNALDGVLFEINHGVDIANRLTNGETMEVSHEYDFDVYNPQKHEYEPHHSEIDYLIKDKNGKVTRIIEAKKGAQAFYNKWIKKAKTSNIKEKGKVLSNQAQAYFRFQEENPAPIEIHIKKPPKDDIEKLAKHNHYMGLIEKDLKIALGIEGGRTINGITYDLSFKENDDTAVVVVERVKIGS